MPKTTITRFFHHAYNPAMRTGIALFLSLVCALAGAQTTAPADASLAPVQTIPPDSPAAAAPNKLSIQASPTLGNAASPPPAPTTTPAPQGQTSPELILTASALPETTPAAQNLWDRMRLGFSMPELNTQLATDKTQWYAKQPDYVARMAQRGGQYLFHIVEELEKRGMPTELALLPFVESAFNPQAVSSAKAAGMWQFMPATGKYFNLKQNVWQDDRRGVVESTRAALDYLQKLHGMFGDWHLALAAYNWGEGSVQRAINKNKAKGLSTEYTALKMPLETQQYVPKFQAVKNIIQSPESFGIKLIPLANAAFFASVVKERDIDVDLAAKFAGLSLPEFKALNPGFKTPVILGESKSEILLPASKVGDFNAALQSYSGALSSWTTAQITSTSKPSALAQRYGMSEAQLREVNNIPPRMLIKAGSILVVPKLSSAPAQSSNISLSMADNAQISLAPEAVRRAHTVRQGETIASLARRYGVSAADIREWNAGISGDVSKGQKLTLYVAAKAGKTARARTQTASKTSKKRVRKA